MKHASRVLLTIIICGLAVLVGGQAAEAGKRRVAVLDVEGARNHRLRDDVAKLVGQKHKVLSSKAYRKAAKKAKAKRLRPKDVRRVAALLAVDGIIEGQLVAEDNGYVLRLRLREGATGKTVRKFTVFLRSPKMSRKIRKQLSKRLLKAINNLEPISADEDEWSEDDEQKDLEAERRRARKAERKRRKKERADKRKRMRAEKRNRKREDRRRARDFIDDSDIEAARGSTDDNEDDFDDFDDFDDDDFDFDDDDDDDGDDSDEDDRGSIRRGAPDPRTAAVTVHAGATVIGRQLKFTYRTDIAMPPSQYNGAYAPGATLSGEFYPMAFGSDSNSKAKNIGFAFDVERSIGLSSQIATAEGMEPIKLTTQRQKSTKRMSWALGSMPSSARLSR